MFAVQKSMLELNYAVAPEEENYILWRFDKKIVIYTQKISL